MDVMVANFLQSNALPESLSDCTLLAAMTEQAHCVPLDYKPPNRQAIGSTLLDGNYDTMIEKQYKQLNLDTYVFGLTMFGASTYFYFVCNYKRCKICISSCMCLSSQDGLTHQKPPFLNILCSGVHNHNTLLEFVDCTGHYAECNTKDTQYIADTMKPYITKLDPTKQCVDFVVFDGTSNFQKGENFLRRMIRTLLLSMEHTTMLASSARMSMSSLKSSYL